MCALASHRLVCLSALTLLMAICSCASGPPASPAEVARAQIGALAAGDEAAARSLLAQETRSRSPQWPAPEDLPDPASVAEVERVAVWSGARELELVRGVEGWTIRRGVLALFRLDSAEGALAAFGRALRAGDLGLVAALVPEVSRPQLAPGTLERAFAARRDAWVALGEAIGAGRTHWVSHQADRAEVDVELGVPPRGGDPPGDAVTSRVVLVREDSGWKVFDLRPWDEYTAPETR